ncbi:hypothetical protein NE236_21100 [Actinoallomurus purpureus]|uniref:hypothetical protein n=1 Tax=Actinoallomurus purpureus TaxID=478114 RepID=UPI002093A3CD|nr:hypothetical protein [Actinoallomurus purpureus]MCO6007479.1 hypothetical protein [Actinoallomurus purpureus]
MRKFKQGAVLTVAAAAVLAGSVAVSSPAEAASSPIAACGGGSYHEIDHHNLGAVATIHLLYNGTTDCVVTWKNPPYAGTTTRTQAFIAKENSSGVITGYIYDDKNYAFYAGPVKINAPGTCIDWGGGVPINGDFTIWTDPFSHCG